MSAVESDNALATLQELLELPVTDESSADLRSAADKAVREARSNKEVDLLSALDLSLSLELRGNILRDLGEIDEAKSDYFEALGLLVSARNADEAIARVSTQLAIIHDNAGEAEQAIPHYERAIDSYNELHPPAILDVASLSNNLAFLYEETGNFDRAETLLLTALGTCHEQLGPEHDQTASLYNNVGSLYFKAEHDDRAREMHMLALDGRIALYGDIHPETAQSHGNLALVFVRSGEMNAAKRHFSRALDGFENDLDSAREDYETVAANFRDVLESVGDQRAITALDARLAEHAG